MEEVKNGGRLICLDIARIIGICAVVMIHVVSGFVSTNPANTAEFVLGNICLTLSRVGVPFFVMISGALMLREEKELTGKMIWKKIKQLLFLLFFWSGCYAVLYSVAIPLVQGDSINIKTVLYQFIMGHYHLWYLYMTIGLYAITPFLRCIVKRENKRLVLYFLLLAAIVQFVLENLPAFYVYVDELRYVAEFIDTFELDFVCGYTAYYVLGWYVVHIGFTKKESIYLYALGIVSFVGMILIAQFVPDKYTPSSTAFSIALKNKGILSLFYTVGAFVLCTRLTQNRTLGIKTKKCIELGSKLSFGVYVIHVAILLLTQKLFAGITSPWVEIPVVWITTMGISYLVCYVMSKIPYIKNLVRA